MHNRIVTPNGQPAIPQIDGVQLACAMLLNGRCEDQAPEEQAREILDRITALMNELGRRAQGEQHGH